MPSAEVGSLRINLAANSAEFTTELDKAGNALDRFGNSIGIANLRAKIGMAAIAAAVVAGVYKIGQALNEAVDKGAELVKLSDKIGVPFEKLADLAQGANVPVAALGDALITLQKNMADIASGDKTSAAARSFSAMGVSVVDANGKLKDAMTVLAELSDKFGTYTDGANKVALATNTLGNRALELQPILQNTSTQLAELAEDAHETGRVMSKETAEQAETLRENLKELGRDAEGLGIMLLERLIPTFGPLVQKFTDWVDEMKVAEVIAKSFDVAINSVVNSGIILKATYEAVTGAISNFATVMKDFFTGNWSEGIKNYEAAQTSLVANAKQQLGEMRGLWDGPQGVAAAAERTKDTITKTVAPPTITSLKSITDAQREWNKAVQEGEALVKQLRTPMEVQERSVYALSAAHKEGKITAEQMALAQQAAVYTTQNAYASMASNVAGALTQVFSHSKGVAIAAALINTYEAVTKALATYPPPFSYVAAGAALAAGLAQVAKIRSTNKGGGGGGGGGSVSAGAAATSQGPQQAPQQLIVQGIKSDHFYTGDAVAGIARALVDYQKNGGQVVIQQ